MMPKIACVRDSDSCARSRTNSPGVPGGVRDFVALTAPSVSEPEVRLLDVRALLQRLARAVEHDAPVLDDVGAVRERQRARDVLLDEQEQPRAGHEAAADGAHLLLAARERARQLPLALAQAWKQREDDLQRGRTRGAVARAQLEVLAHAHAREELAPLRHVSDAARDHLRAGSAVDALALELDPAAAQGQQPADRPQRRRLAGPVAADERDHLARAHLQRDLAHGHEVAVAGLDAIEAEQGGHIPRPGTPR